MVHRFNFSLYSAGKCNEQAILLCKELGQLQDIARLAEEACLMYQTHGQPDAGALCLDRAAKMIETQYPDKAVELYKRGVDVVMVGVYYSQDIAFKFCNIFFNI